jgi:2-dehydro-3-deoxyphosphogluconate aldolase/(4S)-4-hydroxy-2-oxoglutarate aldolase
VRALASIIPEMRFVPTGGIGKGDLRDYLAVRATLACGGTWLTPPDLLATRDFAEIQRRALAARAISTAARKT